jgi:hypothetical protein
LVLLPVLSSCDAPAPHPPTNPHPKHAHGEAAAAVVPTSQPAAKRREGCKARGALRKAVVQKGTQGASKSGVGKHTAAAKRTHGTGWTPSTAHPTHHATTSRAAAPGVGGGIIAGGCRQEPPRVTIVQCLHETQAAAAAARPAGRPVWPRALPGSSSSCKERCSVWCKPAGLGWQVHVAQAAPAAEPSMRGRPASPAPRHTRRCATSAGKGWRVRGPAAARGQMCCRTATPRAGRGAGPRKANQGVAAAGRAAHAASLHAPRHHRRAVVAGHLKRAGTSARARATAVRPAVLTAWRGGGAAPAVGSSAAAQAGVRAGRSRPRPHPAGGKNTRQRCTGGIPRTRRCARPYQQTHKHGSHTQRVLATATPHTRTPWLSCSRHVMYSTSQGSVGQLGRAAGARSVQAATAGTQEGGQ